MFETSEHAGTRSRLSASALVIGMTLTWASVALAQRFSAAPLGAEFAASVVAVPLFGWALARQSLGPKRLTFLGIASLPVGAMLVSSLLAPARFPALLGEPPLWQGWLLWAAALGWLWITAAGADESDLLRLVRFLAIAGTVTALWALLERCGVLPNYDPSSGTIMAFFDNSQSMGQALVITIAATAGLAARKGESASYRLLWWLLVAVQVAALVGAKARAALVAVVFGVFAYGLLETRKDGVWRFTRAASAVVVAGMVTTFVALCVIWSGGLGRPAYAAVDGFLGGRLSIWSHVGESMASNLMFGTGPARFESFARWNVLPDGRLDVWTTHDQHSILLTWLMDTGVFGMLLLSLATISMAVLVARSVRHAGATHSARILAAGTAAAFVAMLASWPEPLAVLSVTAAVGCLLAAGEFAHMKNPRPLGRLAPLIVVPVVMACLAIAVTLWAIFPTVRLQFAQSQAKTTAEMMVHLEQGLVSTRDITYLENELYLMNCAGAVLTDGEDAIDVIRRLAENYPREAEGSVEIPYYALEMLWTHGGELSPEEAWRLSCFYAEKGELASDASDGLWDYALARAALVEGRSDAPTYVAAAMNDDLPAEARAFLTDWNR